MGSRRGFGVAALGVAFVLSACGGGDGGGGGPGNPDLVITYGLKPFNVTIFDDDLLTLVCERVTLTPEPAQFTVRVLDSGPTWKTSGLQLFPSSIAGSHLACMPLVSTLAPGVHSGTLTVQICRDTACASPYTLSEPTLQYAVDVHHVVPGLPLLTAVIKVSGAQVANPNEGTNGYERTYAVQMTSGQLLEVDPSEPFVWFAWSNGNDDVVLSGFTAPQPGALLTTVTLAAGFTTGTAEVWGRSADGRTVRVSLTVTR